MQSRTNWRLIHTISYDEWQALEAGVKPEGPNVDPEIIRPRKERRQKPYRDDKDF